MQLILTEKKSVARAISKAIKADKRGNGFFTTDNGFTDATKTNDVGGYIVSWCAGHLLEPATPEDYNEKLKKVAICRFAHCA